VKKIRCLMLVSLLAVALGACVTSKNDPTPTSGGVIILAEQPSTRIAYLARRGERLGIYVWDLETGTEKKLTGDLESVQLKFSWSPDGTRLVFQDGFRYEETELYVADVLSGELEQLTNNFTMDENPDWSPQGNWIAFQSGVDASGGSKLWLIDPDSRERKTVIDDPDIRADNSMLWPLWSPQAIKIAIAGPAYRDMAWLIFDVNSGRMIQLIRHEGADVGIGPDMAAWYPNGQEFAYVISNEDGTADIYIQPLEAQTVNEPRKLTDLPCNAVWLSWHPKGKALLFTCAKLDDTGEPQGHLYTVDVDTLEIQQLTHKGQNYYGSWSPDGERIAFGTADQDGTDFVAIMDADGSNLTVLEATGSEAIWSPKWAPVSGP
jgi:TolB protein